MNCPNDRTTLDKQNYEADVDVDICPECQGIWLDQSELEKIQESKERDYRGELSQIPDPIIKAYQLARAKNEGERNCPKCDQLLSKKEYAFCSGITIDVCPKCLGIWLDSGELKALELFFERARLEVPQSETKPTRDEFKHSFFKSLQTLFEQR